MSETALCSAVVDQIKTVLTCRSERWIDIRPDGKPPSAIVPSVFVSVWHAGAKPSSGVKSPNNYIDENHGIGVTVSLIITPKHVDYWGVETNKSWDGSLNYAVRRIIGAVHQNPQVLANANGRINTSIASPFIEMLSWIGTEAKQEQGTKWWGTETTAAGKVNPVTGWSQKILFGGARRIQSLGIDEFT